MKHFFQLFQVIILYVYNSVFTSPIRFLQDSHFVLTTDNIFSPSPQWTSTDATCYQEIFKHYPIITQNFIISNIHSLGNGDYAYNKTKYILDNPEVREDLQMYQKLVLNTTLLEFRV